MVGESCMDAKSTEMTCLTYDVLTRKSPNDSTALCHLKVGLNATDGFMCHHEVRFTPVGMTEMISETFKLLIQANDGVDLGEKYLKRKPDYQVQEANKWLLLPVGSM